MKISTKGRYALRVMLDMAWNDTGECIKVKDMATRQGVSEKYLEQIISILTKAGFLRSVRGAQGGYLLTREPKDYTVGDIIRLTEGSMAPVACLDPGAPVCERAEDCDTLSVWQELYDAINGVIDNITLADLLERKRKRLEILDFNI